MVVIEAGPLIEASVFVQLIRTVVSYWGSNSYFLYVCLVPIKSRVIIKQVSVDIRFAFEESSWF